ncbi:MAG: DNA gyrase C-terminal beta-propeller domain-containing protein, partial [Parvularculaceae bacterium]
MFATRSGTVRRNKLSDFQRINRSGKIAMKLEEEWRSGQDGIVGVSICQPDANVLLTTANGVCIRFPVEDIRVFAGRTSTGVRGIRLDDSDEVISMAILNGVEATSEEARAYLKHAAAMRRAAGEDGDDAADDDSAPLTALSPQRIAELGGAEQFVLTVTRKGFGKRTSSFEYRTSGRGGKGIIAIVVNDRNGPVCASFPVEDGDQIMLVTDGGQLIRTPVGGIRVAGRNTQGVTIFRTGDDEKVVSVERIGDIGEEEAAESGDADNGDGE